MSDDKTGLAFDGARLTNDDFVFEVDEIQYQDGVAVVTPAEDIGYERVEAIRPENSAEFLRDNTSIQEKLDEAGVEGESPEKRLGKLDSYESSEKIGDSNITKNDLKRDLGEEIQDSYFEHIGLNPLETSPPAGGTDIDGFGKAKQKADLTGVDPDKASNLEDAGFENLEDIAQADIGELGEANGIGEDRLAPQIKKEAATVLEADGTGIGNSDHKGSSATDGAGTSDETTSETTTEGIDRANGDTPAQEDGPDATADEDMDPDKGPAPPAPPGKPDNGDDPPGSSGAATVESDTEENTPRSTSRDSGGAPGGAQNRNLESGDHTGEQNERSAAGEGRQTLTQREKMDAVDRGIGPVDLNDDQLESVVSAAEKSDEPLSESGYRQLGGELANSNKDLDYRDPEAISDRADELTARGESRAAEQSREVSHDEPDPDGPSL